MVRLAAVAPAIAVLARTDTAVVGAAFTNRTHVAAERMFGPFANTATLVVPCDWELSFRAFIGQIVQTVIDVQARAEIPFPQLRAEMEARQVPLPARHLFLHMATPRPPLRSAGLELTWESARRPLPGTINLRFDQCREEKDCRLIFDARIYDTAGMADFSDRIVRFATAAARHADMRLRELVAASGIALGVRDWANTVALAERATSRSSSQTTAILP
jgi:hypothetical protein